MALLPHASIPGFRLWYLTFAIVFLPSPCRARPLQIQGPSLPQTTVSRENTCNKDQLDTSIKQLHEKMLSEAQRELAYRERSRVTNCRETAENLIRSNPCGIETRVTFQCTLGSYFLPWERQVKLDVSGSTDRNGSEFLTVVSYVSVIDETQPKLEEKAGDRWQSRPPERLAENKLKRIEDCNVGFEVPKEWQMDIRESGPECQIRLRPKGWKDEVRTSEILLPEYPLEVRVFFGSFLKAADEDGFAWRQGKWIAYGRQGSESGADEINGPGWVGLRAAPAIGMHYKKSGYAGLGDTDRVLIQGANGRIARLDGLAQPEAVDEILKTFRFLSGPSSTR
jgi:hypothetical protein